MRHIILDPHSGVSDEILHAISTNVPSRFLCPQLRVLNWKSSTNLTFNRTFVSSNLTRFQFVCHPTNIEILGDLASVMAELQTSSLQWLVVDISVPEGPVLTNLTVALSSAILRCGPFLNSIIVPVPLTDAAIRHIMRLPELFSWATRNGPPDVSGFPLSNTFPKLRQLSPCSVKALKWLPFFNANTYHTSSGRVVPVPRNHGPHQTLISIFSPYGAPTEVDTTVISPILLFRGLVELQLESICSRAHGCSFHLTDDDVGKIVAALPNLTTLNLGRACSADSCETTIASLLIISTGCKNLKHLTLHFRTRNLLHDLKSMPNDPRLRDLFQLPRCGLELLDASRAPLRMAQGYKRTAEEFLRIFPSIRKVSGGKKGWQMVNRKLQELILIRNLKTYSTALHLSS